MKLAQFIQTNIEQLLEDWETAAIEVAPVLKGENSGALRDHARSMLEFIARDLVTSQTREESARKALGHGEVPALDISGDHGTGRLEQGFSVVQMIQELLALRARVTTAWSNERKGLNGKDIDELVRFNEAVDQLIIKSSSSYSGIKEQETRLFETMLKISPDPAAIYAPDGRHLFINTAMAHLINATHKDVIGRSPSELGLPQAKEMHDAITTTVKTRKTQRREFYHRLPSGHEVNLDCQFVPVFNHGKAVEAVIKTARDITERTKKERDVWRNANFDSLTGIPNRRMFIDRLEQTIVDAERKGRSFALLFIDLDRFKQANDQLGHIAGDQLLAQVAERLSNSTRAVDTLARLGGDEFTLILKETGRSGAEEAADKLLHSLEEAFEVGSRRVHISASIGLTFFPDDGRNVSQLMHNADQAMYTAKEQGGQQVHIFESWMAHSESDHMRLNKELNIAVAEDQLEVYYQPIIDIRTGTISRAEALLRWNHPSRGLLTPDDFLSTTEYSATTENIAAFVLKQAVTSSIRWRDLHDEAFPININESPASFVTRSLVEEWRARLTQMGLNESRITMELSPASLNNIRTSGFNPIRSLGLEGLRLHLAIDDFGIEPFALPALQQFKMESVKVDRDLVRNAGQGGDADRLLEAIIAMAHAINVCVVAVGVETGDQQRFLSDAGCDYAQGFLFSKPLSQHDFEALLRQDRQLKSC